MFTSKTPVKAQYSFNVENTDAGYLFKYSGTKFTISQFVAVYIIGGIIMGIYSMWTHHDAWSGLKIWFLCCTAFCVGHTLTRKAKFTINEKHLIVGNTTYDMDHINEFCLTDDGKGFYYIGFRYGEKDIKLTKVLKRNAAELIYKRVVAISKSYVQS